MSRPTENPSGTIEISYTIQIHLENHESLPCSGFCKCNMDSWLGCTAVVLAAVLGSGFSMRVRLVCFRPPGFAFRVLAHPAMAPLGSACICAMIIRKKILHITMGAFRSSCTAFQQHLCVYVHEYVCSAQIIIAFCFRYIICALDCMFRIVCPLARNKKPSSASPHVPQLPTWPSLDGNPLIFQTLPFLHYSIPASVDCHPGVCVFTCFTCSEQCC